jgi:MutL protein
MTAAGRTIATPRATTEVSLLLDVGSAWTKGIVVGRSAGRWRIAAHAAQPSTWGESDLIGTLAARLSGAADQRLKDRLVTILSDAPRITCHTPARPGRIAVAAVSADLSGRGARRAAESAGWVVAEMATLDDGRPAAERLAALQSAEVDAWLLAGGFDDETGEAALEMAGLVAAARGGGQTPVLWAGSPMLTDKVVSLFEARLVRALPNPRPSADRENPLPLRRYLEALLERLVEPGGRRQLAPVGFSRAVMQLARGAGRRISAIDLGARYATWVLADAAGHSESRVLASGGLTSPTLTVPGSPARIAHSIDVPVDELAVADALQNLRARPGALPQTEEELAIVHGAARALLKQLVGDESAFDSIDLLIGAGRTIAAAPTPAHSMGILLDGARPLGVTQLAIDPSGALGPLGALEDREIGEGVGMLRDDLLAPLGAAVVCRGGRSGHPAFRITVHRAGWPSIGPIEVRGGQLQLVPLGRGQVAELEIELEPGISIGGARRARRSRASVLGGSVGLALDARDVPLLLPRRTDDRRTILAAWRDALQHEPQVGTGEAT